MSDDSDNEFGSLAPTTPLVPVKRPSRTNKPIAGPSKAKAKTKVVNASPESSEIEYLDDPQQPMDISSDHEPVVPVEPQKKTRGKRQPTHSEDVPVIGNSTSRAKGKGKVKADPKPKPSRKPVNAKAPGVVDDTEPESAVPRAAQKSRRNKSAVATPTETSRADITATELERLRQKLQDVEAQRDALSKQLEELFRVRSTDAEQILEQQSLQYEARIQTQEALIKELTTQAARVEPLTRSGKSSVLYLLTREAADEEKRIVERDLARLKDMVTEKDAIISDNKKQISGLQQELQEVRAELKAEIERSKALASNSSRKAPPGQGRSQGTILGNDSPKNTEVIRLYEDMTNILVPVLRFGTSQYFLLNETNFTCIYTFVPGSFQDEDENGKSLSFNLRFYYDKPYPDDPEPMSQQDLHAWVQYTPLELDKESSDFVEKLNQLAGSFHFKRYQLPVFLDTLHRSMREASKVDRTEYDEDSVSVDMEGDEI